MFEEHFLFDADDPKTGKYDVGHHLAEMVSLLGPPPKEFLEKAGNSDAYFDEKG